MKVVNMSLEDVMAQLEAWGNEKRREINIQNGDGANQFGVGKVQLRDLAKKLKKNHGLAMQLWNTGNTDAMILATMLMDSDKLSKQEIDDMIKPITYSTLIDELVYNVIVKTNFSNELGAQWLDSPQEFIGRAGWNIQISNILTGKQDDIDYEGLLAKIESEMKSAPKRKQGSINRCLVEIGVHFPEYTKTCMDIGERIGKLDNKPVHKGCTSSYAPEWISAVINRKNN